MKLSFKLNFCKHMENMHDFIFILEKHIKCHAYFQLK
jgi:hypothetical protein